MCSFPHHLWTIVYILAKSFSEVASLLLFNIYDGVGDTTPVKSYCKSWLFVNCQLYMPHIITDLDNKLEYALNHD